MSITTDAKPISRRRAALIVGATIRQLEHAVASGSIPERLTTADLPWLADAAKLSTFGVAFYAAARAVRAGWRPPTAAA